MTFRGGVQTTLLGQNQVFLVKCFFDKIAQWDQIYIQIFFSSLTGFGQTVNPTSTRGADYAHHSTTSSSRFLDLATALEFIFNFPRFFFMFSLNTSKTWKSTKTLINHNKNLAPLCYLVQKTIWLKTCAANVSKIIILRDANQGWWCNVCRFAKQKLSVVRSF